MNADTKIWIIDNDKEFIEFYREALSALNDVRIFYNLDDFSKTYYNTSKMEHPDLIITDLTFQGQDLLPFMEEHEEIFNETLTLVVTSSTDIRTLRQCLMQNVEDIILKPCARIELLIKIDKIFRDWPERESIRFDPIKSTICANGNQSQALTKKEYQILLVLTDSSNKTASREKIVEKVWNGIKVSRKSLDVHICNLRKKIASTGILVTTQKPNLYRLTFNYSVSGSESKIA